MTIDASSGSFAGAQAQRDNVIQLIIQYARMIQHVTLNETSLPRYDTLAEFEAAVKGWYQDEASLVLAKSGKLDMISPKVFKFQFGNLTYLPVALRQE